LAEVIGLHERQGLASGGIVQHEVEVRPVAGIRRIKLRPEVVQERTGHAVKRGPGVEDQTPARLVLRAARGQRLKGAAHHADGLVHRQKLLNVGLAEK